MNVIIPAAGAATRMRPLSNNTSKAMLSVNGKPILQYIIDELESYDEVNNVVIVVGDNIDIQEYIERKQNNLNKNYLIVKQNTQSGPLNAIHCGWNVLPINAKDDPLLVWLGDTICLDKFTFEKPFVVTSIVDDFERWCLYNTKTEEFVDKPKTDPMTRNALIGIYYFPQDVKTLMEQTIEICENISSENTKEPHQIITLLKHYQNNVFDFDNITTNEWYDCGELYTYYQTKARLLKRLSRSHNTLDVDYENGFIIKSSTTSHGSDKIANEKFWYEDLCNEQLLYVPRIIETDRIGKLKMSWEPGIPLSEILMYENISKSQIVKIFEKVLHIIITHFHKNVRHQNLLNQIPDNSHGFDLNELPSVIKLMLEHHLTKNLKRVTSLPSNMQSIARKWIEYVGMKLSASPMLCDTIHGDLHFGNILFSPYNGDIKFIDPRGSFGGEVGKFGDPRLDIGKLYHDIFVGYNYIVANQYKIVDDKVLFFWDEDIMNALIQKLDSFVVDNGYGEPRLLKMLGIVCVLTCIPFHKEDQQRTNALLLRCKNLMETI